MGLSIPRSWSPCLAGAALLLGTALPRASAATDIPIDTTVVGSDRFDYAVPDAPAFQLLRVDARSVLRPGTRRELAVMADRADLKNFAIECAPFLLAHDGKVPLAQYRKWRALYNLRISGGASSVGAGTSAAIGLRWSLLDSSDPYMNAPLVRAATRYGERMQTLRDSAYALLRDPAVLERALPLVPESLRKDFEEFARDPAKGPRVALNALQRESPTDGERVLRALNASIQEAYAAERDTFRSEWNRDVLELGAALGGNTVDSVSRRARLLAYGGWLVGGRRLGRQGQLLVGANTRLERNEATGTMSDWLGGAGTRFYYGTNGAKAALEADIAWQRRGRPTYAGELGAEIRIVPSLWIDPFLELSRNDTGHAQLSAHVSVRFADLGVIPTPWRLQSNPK